MQPQVKGPQGLPAAPEAWKRRGRNPPDRRKGAQCCLHPDFGLPASKQPECPSPLQDSVMDAKGWSRLARHLE